MEPWTLVPSAAAGDPHPLPRKVQGAKGALVRVFVTGRTVCRLLAAHFACPADGVDTGRAFGASEVLVMEGFDSTKDWGIRSFMVCLMSACVAPES